MNLGKSSLVSLKPWSHCVVTMFSAVMKQVHAPLLVAVTLCIYLITAFFSSFLCCTIETCWPVSSSQPKNNFSLPLYSSYVLGLLLVLVIAAKHSFLIFNEISWRGVSICGDLIFGWSSFFSFWTKPRPKFSSTRPENSFFLSKT